PQAAAERTGCRGGAPARGPAPSSNSARFFGLPLRPPRLLLPLRPVPALPRPTLLLAGLPPGVTSRPPARCEASGAAPPRRTASAIPGPPAAVSPARTSSRIFPLMPPRYGDPRPQEQRKERAGRVFSVPPFPFSDWGARKESLMPDWEPGEVRVLPVDA